jgi:hypothetical protein
MRKWLSGFSVGFTVMGIAAMWYRSQLRAIQQKEAARDALHDEMFADVEAEWNDVPTDRKLRVYMKMAEDGISLTEDDAGEATDDAKKKKRKNGRGRQGLN